MVAVSLKTEKARKDPYRPSDYIIYQVFFDQLNKPFIGDGCELYELQLGQYSVYQIKTRKIHLLYRSFNINSKDEGYIALAPETK